MNKRLQSAKSHPIYQQRQRDRRERISKALALSASKTSHGFGPMELDWGLRDGGLFSRFRLCWQEVIFRGFVSFLHFFIAQKCG
jgi:hypothetical protein